MNNLPPQALNLESVKRWHQAGRLQEALVGYRELVAAQPTAIEAWYWKGVAEVEAELFEEACRSLAQAICLAPHIAELHTQSGHAWRMRQDLPKALQAYRQALALEPDDPSGWNNVGATLQALGEWDEAIAAYQQAIARAPEQAAFHNNLGLLYAEVGRYAEAVVAHERAIQLQPDYWEAIYNQGNAYQRLGDYTAAVERYETVLKAAPKASDVYYNYAIALRKLQRYEAALAACEHRYALSPEVGNSAASLLWGLQRHCDWPRIQGLTDQVIAAVEGNAPDSFRDPVAPFAFLGLPGPTTPAQQLRCAEKWTGKIVATSRKHPLNLPRRPVRRRPPRLRIGYLSEDFHMHPVAYAVAELFAAHDRQRFEVIGYSYGPDDGSSVRQRIARGFDIFHDLVHLTDGEAAELIAEDEIDILVDLQGYTGESRTVVIAQRPAPLQVNYLGYPGSMGADFIDYILVDKFVVPIGQQPYFREKLVHLPGTYLVSDSQYEIDPTMPSRRQAKLPDEAFVFCCFNNSYKITPMMFDVWMRLLREVPQAVLWLRDWGERTNIHLRCEAAAREVDPGRLIFAPSVEMPLHAARHQLVDLFLDTFPYNAHATASLSLRMGVPLVTCVGETFPSRVAGSLLHSLGLDELITYSLEDYAIKALELATVPGKLADLKNRLRRLVPVHPSFDGKAFARKLEIAYDVMWSLYEHGRPPQAIEIQEQWIV
jgi:predicted O-linked N-acetylglucosamine transferase (SPINDLY family)